MPTPAWNENQNQKLFLLYLVGSHQLGMSCPPWQEKLRLMNWGPQGKEHQSGRKSSNHRGCSADLLHVQSPLLSEKVDWKLFIAQSFLVIFFLEVCRMRAWHSLSHCLVVLCPWCGFRNEAERVSEDLPRTGINQFPTPTFYFNIPLKRAKLRVTVLCWVTQEGCGKKGGKPDISFSCSMKSSQ